MSWLEKGSFVNKAIKEQLLGEWQEDFLCCFLMHGMRVVAQARGVVFKSQDETDIVAGIRKRAAKPVRLADGDAFHLRDGAAKLLHCGDDFLLVSRIASVFQPDKTDLLQTALGRGRMPCGAAAHEQASGREQREETKDGCDGWVNHAAA